jgi:hypothetical protein
MPVRAGPPQPAPPPRNELPPIQEPAPLPPEPDPTPPGTAPYPADKARGATVNLRTRSQRLIFFGGLVGAVLLVLLLRLFA